MKLSDYVMDIMVGAFIHKITTYQKVNCEITSPVPPPPQDVSYYFSLSLGVFWGGGAEGKDILSKKGLVIFIF